MQRITGPVEAPALFGKLSTRGDFVRAGTTDEAAGALEVWLTEAVERSQGEVPEAPVRFLFKQGASTLLGTWVKSRDEVGRGFPLVAFCRVSPELASLRWAPLPTFFDGYLRNLEGALSAQLMGTPESALAAIRSVPPPHESELLKALFDGEAQLAQESITAFGRRAFGAAAQQPMAYALLTIREACRRAAVQVTLDLPMAEPEASFVWLELLAAAAVDETQHNPALLWSPDLSRGLASFGAPSPLSCAFLLDPAHGSNARWPLSTSRVDSQEALGQLPPSVQTAVASDVTLAALLENLRGAR